MIESGLTIGIKKKIIYTIVERNSLANPRHKQQLKIEPALSRGFPNKHPGELLLLALQIFWQALEIVIPAL